MYLPKVVALLGEVPKVVAVTAPLEYLWTQQKDAAVSDKGFLGCFLSEIPDCVLVIFRSYVLNL